MERAWKRECASLLLSLSLSLSLCVDFVKVSSNQLDSVCFVHLSSFWDFFKLTP